MGRLLNYYFGVFFNSSVNRRFPEITGEDNLTVFSYSWRVKSPEWKKVFVLVHQRLPQTVFGQCYVIHTCEARLATNESPSSSPHRDNNNNSKNILYIHPSGEIKGVVRSYTLTHNAKN